MSFPPPVLTRQRFNIASRSAKVRVVASAAHEPSVTGGILINNPDGSLTVQPLPTGAAEIVLICPPMSDLSVGTASGRVELCGRLGDVSVVTASGRVEIEQAVSVDVRSSSAAVKVARCEGECRVATKSGAIMIAVAGKIEISTQSGKVVVSEVAKAVVQTVSSAVSICGSRGAITDVRTMSGRVDVSVPSGSTPAIDLASVSGKVSCETSAGSDGHIRVRTASGAIRITIR